MEDERLPGEVVGFAEPKDQPTPPRHTQDRGQGEGGSRAGDVRRIGAEFPASDNQREDKPPGNRHGDQHETHRERRVAPPDQVGLNGNFGTATHHPAKRRRPPSPVHPANHGGNQPDRRDSPHRQHGREGKSDSSRRHGNSRMSPLSHRTPEASQVQLHQDTRGNIGCAKDVGPLAVATHQTVESSP